MITKQIKLCATGILIRKGAVLLGKRVVDDPSYPGMWCTPGGGVEFGETIEEALKREFVEEVGLKVVPQYPIPRIIERYDPIRMTHTIGFFYRVSLACQDIEEPRDGLSELKSCGKSEIEDMWLSGKITPLTGLGLVAFDLL